jgi:hypothetical protein
MFPPTSLFTDLKITDRCQTVHMRHPDVKDTRPATRLIMDDLSYYLGRLICSLGFHPCEDTEALLSVGHVAFWVLLAGMAFSHQVIQGVCRTASADQQDRSLSAPAWAAEKRVTGCQV